MIRNLLPTIVALYSQLSLPKEIRLSFSQTTDANRVLSRDKSEQRNRGSSKFFVFLLVSLFFINSNTYGQCTFPASGTTQVNTQFSFCGSGAINAINVNAMGDNNYVVVNVVQGSQYSFVISDAWSGADEVMNIYKNADLSKIVNSYGGNNVNINYTAGFTGQIRILINKGYCGSTTGSGTGILTMTQWVDATVPSKPTLLTISNFTCSGFTANWNTVANVTGYKLDVSTVSDFSTFVGVYNSLNVGLVTSYNITGLPAGTTYYYRVRAYNTCSVSANSNSGSVIIPVLPTATISGTATVCQNASSPSVTFTNTLSNAITVTYTINNGANNTIDVAAKATTNGTATVTVPTTDSGTFVYKLVSAAYQTDPTCSTSVTGSATV